MEIDELQQKYQKRLKNKQKAYKKKKGISIITSEEAKRRNKEMCDYYSYKNEAIAKAKTARPKIKKHIKNAHNVIFNNKVE